MKFGRMLHTLLQTFLVTNNRTQMNDPTQPIGTPIAVGKNFIIKD